jgi:hypothetical protein
MEAIQYVGVNELDSQQKSLVDKLAKEHYDKIQRSLNDITSIVVHIKQHKKTGEDAKINYGIHTRVMGSGKVFESTNAADYDLAKALHKSFNDVEKQIMHTLRPDEQKSSMKKKNLG